MEIISEKPPLTIKLLEREQLDAETQIKYKLCFFTQQFHLQHLEANSRGYGQLRNNSQFSLKCSIKPQGRWKTPELLLSMSQSSHQDPWAWLQETRMRIKEQTGFSCACPEECWPFRLALPDSRGHPENLKEYYKIIVLQLQAS